MKIVYMGTPDFAVGCLQRLVALGHDVRGVFCQPDKPQGRKMVLTPPPVKEEALKHSLKVFQPSTLRNGEALELLKELDPELIVVVAYGKILPKEILELPRYGCINIHASILPRLRGAAPIQWAVLKGEKETGVTSMQMDEGLDTGDILLCEKVTIGENETSEELWDRLAALSPDLLEKTLDALQKGELEPKKQDDSLSDYAPMLSREMSDVNWDAPSEEVHNKIRGLYSWPCASTVIGGKKIKLLSSRLANDHSGEPGEIISGTGRLIIACKSGAVEILRLQAEGKKAMSSADYLRGNPVEPGTII